jgi:hypothetical protein
MTPASGQHPRHWRWRLLAALVAITLLSAALRLIALQSSHRVPSDTNPFLYLVSLMQGTAVEQEPNVVATVLYRLSHPMFAILIYFLEMFTGDWIVAARWAAVLPAIFIPPVICLIARQLDGRLASSIGAGILAAVSWPLIERGVEPMPDSLFAFVSALVLLSAITLLRRITVARMILAGLLAGLASATRPNGLFYALTIAIPAVIVLWKTIRSSPPDSAARLTPQQGILLLSVFCVAFFITARGPALALAPLTQGLKAPRSSLLANLLSEPMYAKGKHYRDQRVYSLNADCTELNFSVSQPPSSLAQQIRKHGKDHFWAIASNVRTLLVQTIPRLLQPMTLLFLPLALGFFWLLGQRPMTENLLLALFVFPFLLVIPLIELHDNYILPITIAALPLAGIGLNEMWTAAPTPSRLTRQTLRGTATMLLTGIVGLSLYETATAYRRPDRYITYRQAALWIQQKHGEKFPFAVMSRYHGMYAYLRCTKTSLPVDTLDRVARYCRHTNTRYIVVGPNELDHNEHLRKALADNDTVELPNATFKVVATFTAQWNEPVQLVHVTFTDPQSP